ncbi:hypothetical protein, partial [Gorillibacterium massiliense]|uniref:Lhr family helicase n=1 Tax=Gorillibacterium massiliense TaxID=1280390 RepID=UPI0005924F4F
RAVAARDIEEIRVPRHSLDVFSQQLVAMTATDDWEIGRLTAVLARSDGFHGLPRKRVLAAVAVLAGLYPFSRPLLDWDRETGQLRRRSGTPMAAVMGAGTIPPGTGYPVHHAETRLHLGELDEEFIHESRVGDVFRLGASSWTIRSIRPDRIYVTESPSRVSEIPFWKAQSASRSYELGLQIGRFLADMEERELARSKDTVDWLGTEYFMDRPAIESLLTLVKGQMNVSVLPTDRRIVIEHFVDDTNRHHLVIHSLFGRTFNHTWQLALQTVIAKIIPIPVYANARDNGIEFVLSDWDPSWLSVIGKVTADNLEALLLEELPSTPMFGANFRRIAETSLLLARSFTRIPAWKLRLRSEELLKESLPYAAEFPYLREALEESLEESLSVDEVKRLLASISDGVTEVAVRETRFPSPFAIDFLLDYINVNIYESDTVNRDLQTQVLGVSRGLAEELFGRETIRGAVTPEVLEQERKRLEQGDHVGPGDSGEFLKLLKSRGDMSLDEARQAAGAEAEQWLNQLMAAGKTIRISLGGENRYICADEAEIYSRFPHDAAAITYVLKRHIDHKIAFTVDDLAIRYGMDAPRVRETILQWQQEKLLEPAPFAEKDKEELWTSSKVVSRIVRFSLREFEEAGSAVPAERYAAYLARLHGVQGWNADQKNLAVSRPQDDIADLQRVVAQLQGIYLPVSHWEKLIFPSRLLRYRKETLDLLCASGDIFWLGRKEEGEKEGRIAFFLGESKDLYLPFIRKNEECVHPELLAHLRRKGASFLTVLSRETGFPPSELMARLMDLVWEGRIANDQFAPLRNQSSSASRKAAEQGKFRSGLGRWYVLDDTFDPDNRLSENSNGTVSIDNRQERSAAAWVRHLMANFGIVTKDLVAQISPIPWEDVYRVLKQLEEWGMLTRGFFVSGIPAVQYASKEVVEELRSPWINDDSSETVLVSAADPANPYGISADWPKVNRDAALFSRKPGGYLVLERGRWRLWLENSGKRIVEMNAERENRLLTEGARENEAKRIRRMSAILQMLLVRGSLKRVIIETWNGRSASQSEAADFLENLGAERDRNAYVLWPSTFRNNLHS